MILLTVSLGNGLFEKIFLVHNADCCHYSVDERHSLAGDQSVMHVRSPGDETPMTHYGPSNGVLHQRVYPEEKQSTVAYRNSSADSPTRSLSPVAKRTRSPNCATENEQQQSLHLPSQLASVQAVAGHIPHIVPPNPMIPFVHPLMYSAIDPNQCLDVARPAELLNSDNDRQHSPGTSPNAATSTASVAQAGLPSLMCPTFSANPAYFFGARASHVPGLSLPPDVQMLLPPHLAAYGAAAANLLPSQFPPLAPLTEQDKRFYESVSSFGPHTGVPANLLGHPYLKTFATAGLDAGGGKGTPPHIPVTAALPGLPGYSVDFLLKYQEALNNEALKKSMVSPHSSSPPSKRSSSPDLKKTPLSAPYPFSMPAAYLGSTATATVKSPGPEVHKLSTHTMRPVKNGSVGQPLDPSRASRDRELAYPDNPELADEAGRKLVALAQR